MSRTFRFALVGLETGVSGALAMLAWLAFVSVWYRRTVWWVPNLFASVFYGDSSLRFGFTKYTTTGIALDLFVYGLIGSVFGLIWRDHRGGARLLWTGMAIALAAWYLLFLVLLKKVSPMVHLYTPERQLLIGNVIYGFMLTKFPKHASNMFNQFHQNPDGNRDSGANQS
jgi:hypothetical protein